MTEYVQCQPGPTDADLEAERDTKHAAEVAEWFATNPWAVP
jgi:hypothetical protein